MRSCEFCVAFEHVTAWFTLEYKNLVNLYSLLKVQLHMFQENKLREIQKKFGQQQVQLLKVYITNQQFMYFNQYEI